MNEKVNHLAIIMDGNRRWAEKKGLKSIAGHKAGIDALEKVVHRAAALDIKYLTVYALSTENLKQRNPLEVAALLKLMQEKIQEKLPELKKDGVRIEVFGDIEAFPRALQRAIKKSFRQLDQNRKIQLNFALNYGGRAEILHSVRQVIKTGLTENEVGEENLQSYLYSKDIPDPELIIRTGGEKRLSNFLLWQSAYSELYFTDILWPDFSEKDLNKALEDFQQRKRNFGK